jgi:hypothetical protein
MHGATIKNKRKEDIKAKMMLIALVDFKGVLVGAMGILNQVTL